MTLPGLGVIRGNMFVEFHFDFWNIFTKLDFYTNPSNYGNIPEFVSDYSKFESMCGKFGMVLIQTLNRKQN